MRKKIFLLALVTMLLPLFAKAEPVEINGLYYSLNSNNTASVCSEKYWYTYGDDGSGEYRDKNNWYTGDEEDFESLCFFVPG